MDSSDGESINQTLGTSRAKLTLSAIVVIVSFLICTAAFQFDFHQLISVPQTTAQLPQSVPDFLAASKEQYEYRSVKSVYRHPFDWDIKLRIVFDDPNKLSGLATAVSTSKDTSSDILGEALGDFLAAKTGIVWLPVTTSGSDYKKVWTSASSVDLWEHTLTVKFKIKSPGHRNQ